MHHLSKAMAMSRSPKDLVFSLINDPNTPPTLLKELKPSIESLSTRMAKGIDTLVETSKKQDEENFIDMLESSKQYEKDIDDNIRDKKSLGGIQTSRTSDVDSLKSTDQTTPSNTQEVQSSPREIHTFDGRDGEFRRLESSDGTPTDIRRDSRDRRDSQGGTDTTSLSNSPREDGKRRIHQGGSPSGSSRQSGLVGRRIEQTIEVNPHTLKLRSSKPTKEIEDIVQTIKPDTTSQPLIFHNANGAIKVTAIKNKLQAKLDAGYVSDDEFINNSIKSAKTQDKSIDEYKQALSERRKDIQKHFNITPIKEFGTNYAEFYHDGDRAVTKLLLEKQGQVVGAFYKEGLGDIDLVWGEITNKNKGYGLAHIIDKHPDFDIHILPQIVEKGEIKQTPNEATRIKYII